MSDHGDPPPALLPMAVPGEENGATPANGLRWRVGLRDGVRGPANGWNAARRYGA